MKCGNCSTENSDDSSFCVKCGNNLTGGAPAKGVAQEGFQPIMANPDHFQPTFYEVQQKLLSMTQTYKIKDATGYEFMEARRRISSFFRPLIEIKAADGVHIGEIRGNFWKTEWVITDAQGQYYATITFPFFMWLTKTFTIHTPVGVFRSGGSVFTYRFDAYAPDGRLSFVVDKKIFSIRDTFKIQSNDQLGPFITCLAAVVIDMKFHSNK